MTAFPVEPEVERDRWGRPMVVPEGGGNPTAYTRCTTYVDCLDDKYKLGQWQQRMVAIGLSRRNDLLLSVAAHADDKSKLDALCQQSLDAAAASAKATTGTALHKMTELADRGESIDYLPADARADLAAYSETTSSLTALSIERFMVLDELKIGGTADRVVEFEGKHYIADIKTGSVDFAALKIAMQLAVYAHSRYYDVKTHTRSALPDVDQQRAIVIHLPAGEAKCSLLWVDIAAGWEAVQVATQVRDWRNRGRRLLSKITSVEATLPIVEQHETQQQPREVADRDVANAVASAASVEELGALWRAHKSVWNAELTELAAARKALLAGGLVK